MNAGILSAIAAYSLWGLLPVYWKAVQEVPAHEILCHRMVWSLGFSLLLLTIKNRWSWIRLAGRSRTVALMFVGSAVLIGANWFTYIWAVTHGHLVAASLGYFINPLVTVLLGVIVLREKLRPWQWASIGIAACGVLYLTYVYGSFPWIGLTLALTFAFYGLMRKTAKLGALEGLSLETAILFLPAAAYLVHLESAGAGAFGHAGAGTTLLLALTGVATALPLLLFAHGVRRISLTTTGLLHYIAPTFQFLLGVFAYQDPCTRTRLIGFCVVWLALLVYTTEGILARRARTEKRGPPGRGRAEEPVLPADGAGPV